MNALHEKAIYDWIVYCSQLPSDQVIWRDENGTAPDVDQYITVQIVNISDLHKPNRQERYEAANPNGQQIVKTHSVLRRFDVVVTCYSKQSNGNLSSRSLMSSVLLRKEHDAANEILRLQGISFVNGLDLQHIPEVDEIGFIGRTLWNPRLNYVQSTEETSTFIETVELTDEQTGLVHTIEVS